MSDIAEVDIASKRQKQDSSGALKPLHQTLGESYVAFHKQYPSAVVRLIEITPELATLIEAGEQLQLIGNASDSDSVLCTRSNTFSIKKVETSNSVFLIPPSGSNNFAIESNCGVFYEVAPIKGKVDTIESILKPTQFVGNEYEKDIIKEKLITRESLSGQVQASESEVDEELRRLQVVEMKGHLRIVCRSAIHEATRALFDEAIEHSWSIDSIDEAICLDALSGYDPAVVLLVLNGLGEKDESTSHWRLNHDLVAKTSAHILFCSQPSFFKWPLDDFMTQWAASVPGTTVNVSEALLEGIAKKIAVGSSGSSSTALLYEPLP